ncbi:MAG: hypothetical protein ABSC77_01250 [Terracidiphilus sp.]|jgi:hypothetical protein
MMPDNSPQDQPAAYTFLGSSPADELLEIAQLYHREAKHLLARAHEAQAEDRQEEAKLLTDLAISKRDQAEEFERAARGEGSDPIVNDILKSEQSLRTNFTPFTSTYSSPEGDIPPEWIEEMKPRKLGPIARAVAWIGSWIT